METKPRMEENGRARGKTVKIIQSGRRYSRRVMNREQRRKMKESILREFPTVKPAQRWRGGSWVKRIGCPSINSQHSLSSSQSSVTPGDPVPSYGLCRYWACTWCTAYMKAKHPYAYSKKANKIPHSMRLTTQGTLKKKKVRTVDDSKSERERKTQDVVDWG